MKRSDVELQIKSAFMEWLAVKGFLGIKPPKRVIEIMWDDHFYPSLGWRLDQLEGKKKKRVLKYPA